MKYNIIKLVRNTAEQYTASVSATFDNLDSAKVNYHQTLASLHNANDVKKATVMIMDEFGHVRPEYTETVDHEEHTEETEA
jgi:C4-type Zn-finger protein